MNYSGLRGFGSSISNRLLYPGNENDAQAYREAGLVDRLSSVGCKVIDAGDVAIPSYLPHHSVPPIRSWPGPRIVWDIVGEKVSETLRQPEQIPLLIGCDCSVVVGTVNALRGSFQEVHVIYIDGDLRRCSSFGAVPSAAACATWFFTHDSALSLGSVLKLSQISQVGSTRGAQSKQAGIQSFSLDDVRRVGPRQLALQVAPRPRPPPSCFISISTCSGAAICRPRNFLTLRDSP